VNSEFVAYPRAIRKREGDNSVDDVHSTLVYSPLSPDQIKLEIDDNRPILVGLDTSGIRHHSNPVDMFFRGGDWNPGEHVVVIVGYHTVGGRFQVVVNDPFDYMDNAPQDPWDHISGKEDLDDGVYDVPYSNWKITMPIVAMIYQIAPTPIWNEERNQTIAHPPAASPSGDAAIASYVVSMARESDLAHRRGGTVETVDGDPYLSVVGDPGSCKRSYFRDDGGPDDLTRFEFDCVAFSGTNYAALSQRAQSVLSSIELSLTGWTFKDYLPPDKEYHVTNGLDSAKTRAINFDYEVDSATNIATLKITVFNFAPGTGIIP
jgi:hypothetical protein